MGMLGQLKGQIFGSIRLRSRVLFCIVGDAHIALCCLLVPGSGVGVEEMVESGWLLTSCLVVGRSLSTGWSSCS